MSDLYEADSYMIRQKVLKLLGAEFHIYSDDSMQQLIGYSKQKALKLKEDIRVYTCLLYTSPSPRDLSTSRMPSSA